MKRIIISLGGMALVASAAWAAPLQRPDTSSAAAPPVLQLSQSVANATQTTSGAQSAQGPRDSKTPVALSSLSKNNAATSSLPEMYGSVLYASDWTSDNAPIGLYRLPQTSGGNFSLAINGIEAGGGGAVKNGIYYYVSYYILMNVPISTVYGYNLETGEKVYQAAGNIDNVAPAGLSIDPTTNEIYGITYRDDLSGFQLAKVSFDGQPATTTIANLAGYWAAFAIAPDGTFYAIRKDVDSNNYITGSTLVKLNRTTGAVTEIGSTGMMPYYNSGAAIDPKTGKMYWAISTYDVKGYLTEVNLTTGVATKVCDFPKNQEVAGLYIPAPLAEDASPGFCSDMTVNFEGTSLSGNVTVIAPATLYDGSAASGSVTITVTANDVVVGTASGTCGEAVTIPCSVAEKGLYTVAVYASNSVGNGPQTKQRNVFIGPDAPIAANPTLKYEDGKMVLTWPAVTKGLNGGNVDPATTTYLVKRWDGNIAADNLSACEFSEAVAMPSKMTSYYYMVTVKAEGGWSTAAISNKVVLGYLNPPFNSDFASNGFGQFTIIDGNNDGKTWGISSGNARMGANAEIAMDDWLITPPIKLESGKGYLISFEAWSSKADIFTEQLEVMWGTTNTAEAMTHTLMNKVSISGGPDDPLIYASYFFPDDDGVYCFGFHGCSAANQQYLTISDIVVEAGSDPSVPGAAEPFTAISDINGGRSVEISFKAPTQCLDESALESLTRAMLFRGDSMIKMFSGISIGGEYSYTDTPTEDGLTTYSLYCYNSAGKGVRATAKTYVGIELPLAPETLTLSNGDNDGTALLSWDAVTLDRNGKNIPADKISYDIYAVENGAASLKYADVAGDEFSFTALAQGRQKFLQYAIAAKTETGMSALTVSNLAPIGTPYTDFEETFPGATPTYEWAVGTEGGATWKICTDTTLQGVESQDGDGGYLSMGGATVGIYGEFISGLISLEDLENPELKFYTFNIINDAGNPDINELAVDVMDENGTWTSLLSGTVDDLCNGEADQWGLVKADLSEYAGKIIQIRFVSEIQYYIYVMIDGISVLEGDGSGVADVPADESFVSQRGLYNLQGQRIELPLESLPRGIYILDGRKVVK